MGIVLADAPGNIGALIGQYFNVGGVLAVVVPMFAAVAVVQLSLMAGPEKAMKLLEWVRRIVR